MGKMLFSSRPIEGEDAQPGFLLLILTLTTWLRSYLAGVFTVRGSFPRPHSAHPYGVGGWGPPPLGGGIFMKSLGILWHRKFVYSSQLLCYSVIHSSPYRLMDICSMLCITIQNSCVLLIFCSDWPTLAIRSPSVGSWPLGPAALTVFCLCFFLSTSLLFGTRTCSGLIVYSPTQP